MPEPENGKYEIKLSSRKNGFYEINIASFDKDGENTLNKIRGIISGNNDETIEINYSQASNNSSSSKIVTFQSLIDDIKEAQSLKLINKNAANPLLAMAKSAKKNYDKGLRRVFLIELNIFQKLLNTLHDVPRVNLIKEDAYQVLFYDINYLINNL